jgi:hypothetical protein
MKIDVAKMSTRQFFHPKCYSTTAQKITTVFPNVPNIEIFARCKKTGLNEQQVMQKQIKHESKR